MIKATTFEQIRKGSLTCRTLRHSWQPYTSAKARGGWDVTLRCPVCETRKHFFLTRTGEMENPRYSYPDYYLVTFSMDQERGRARLAALQDWLD